MISLSRWYDIIDVSFLSLSPCFYKYRQHNGTFPRDTSRHNDLHYGKLVDSRSSRISISLLLFFPQSLLWRISLNIIRACRHDCLLRDVLSSICYYSDPIFHLTPQFVTFMIMSQINERGKALSRREKLVCLSRCILQLEVHSSFRSVIEQLQFLHSVKSF